MCGIFGYIRLKRKNESFRQFYERVITMNNNFNLIKHRGPDNSVYRHLDGNVHMGFHRLAINGLDVSSNQPFLYNNHVNLVCNGEIFNFKELVSKYGFKLHSKSDCEVIVHMYSKFGFDRTVRELDGEFALILYDSKAGIVYVARDHIGIRPLFIGHVSDTELVFASEAKAIMKLAKNVKQFKPGQYVTYDINTNENNIGNKLLNGVTTQWYNFEFPITKVALSEEQMLEGIKTRLIKSTLDRLVSDRPIGCFLSGGLDSSLVTAIVAQVRPHIHTFSIGLENGSDLKAAHAVVSHLNLMNHHEVTFTVEEGIAALPHVIKSLESYDITTIRAGTGQWLLSKWIHENTDIKVLLNGETPDEYMPGYLLFSHLPTNEIQAEATRMLQNLYQFDLLRTDRTTAAWGLETRCPYAAKDLIKFVMESIPAERRQFGGNTGRMEKDILRKAFDYNIKDGKPLLPQSILWRRKHAFSDAVSSKDVSWYKAIEKYAKKIITEDKWVDRHKCFPHNTPVSYESYLYREIFEDLFKSDDAPYLIDKFWIPNIKDENGKQITDPSATILKGFESETTIL